MRKTKIVCTLGPATSSPEKIEALIRAGTNIIRLNFSHGDHAGHRESIHRIRKISAELQLPVGILQDLQGPKIRLGEVPGGTQELLPGEVVVLEARPLMASEDQRPVTVTPVSASDPHRLPVRYPWLADDVHAGERILLADGMVELEAEEIRAEMVWCRVLVGGSISSHKGVNLPLSELRIPSFTEKDRKDLELGCAEGVDMVALSFVRHERDLAPVLEILEKTGPHPPLLLAKIEKPQAVDRLRQILEVVDAVMVARGDLGVEMPIEEVPMIQKRIISEARTMARPVITATQMLRSMVDSPRPTRAEASDVANAVLDGTDAVMLSEESAIGNFPIEAVEMLDRIALVTEASVGQRADVEDEGSEENQTAIARAACGLAHDTGARAIVAATSSGSTARQLARFRPEAEIIGLTPSEKVYHQLALSWGVVPACAEPFVSTDEIFAMGRRYCLGHGLVQPGEQIVITAGLPIAAAGTTNVIHLLEL